MIWRNVLIEIEGVKQPVLPATLLSHHPAALHQCTARSDPLHKRRFSTQRSFSTELAASRHLRLTASDPKETFEFLQSGRSRGYSITLSARTRIDCGNAIPSAFAVF